MRSAIALGAALFLAAGIVEAADIAPQTIEIAKVDVQMLQAGYRASKIIGTSVVHDANENIGKVDDLLVSPDGKTPYAVLSVGGFPGMGSHLVAVPYEQMKVVDKKLILQGGSKESLRMLPEFK
jgi:sporulation protein YlmC with PRC-barrel domain